MECQKYYNRDSPSGRQKATLPSKAGGPGAQSIRVRVPARAHDNRRLGLAGARAHDNRRLGFAGADSESWLSGRSRRRGPPLTPASDSMIRVTEPTVNTKASEARAGSSACRTGPSESARPHWALAGPEPGVKGRRPAAGESGDVRVTVDRGIPGRMARPRPAGAARGKARCLAKEFSPVEDGPGVVQPGAETGYSSSPAGGPEAIMMERRLRRRTGGRRHGGAGYGPGADGGGPAEDRDRESRICLADRRFG
jgi:hypothetical protein